MPQVKEITVAQLDVEEFIKEKAAEISQIVGSGVAINALSGGVDSSTVTMLGAKALGERLKTYFIDNGIMREGEPQQITSEFKKLGVNVEIIDAQDEFFNALKGITDPEEKREAITQTFYKKVFGNLVRKSGAKYLLQGTILTDVDETIAGIKRQHNVFEQLGIDPQEAFGYKIIEPLVQLRKDGVRRVAQGLGLPASIYNRIGIMNIMLVSVTERTREIGLRKAIGATNKDIMVQFLIEAMLMSFIGRVLGILLGWGAATLITVFAGWTVKVSLFSVILATSFSLAVGMVFGLWPAQKASLLDPIEALRYE